MTDTRTNVTTGHTGNPNATRIRLRRLGVLGMAAVAAEAAFFVLRDAAGIELAARSGSSVTEVGPVAVAATAILAALAGWGLLALLERFTTRARLIWTLVAVGFFVVSLLGPAGGVDPGARLGLAVLHLVPAVVLIVGLPWAARAATR
ncbi:DUF6069 family protein [Micromonosporaceae bacterium B7E4]